MFEAMKILSMLDYSALYIANEEWLINGATGEMHGVTTILLICQRVS